MKWKVLVSIVAIMVLLTVILLSMQTLIEEFFKKEISKAPGIGVPEIIKHEERTEKIEGGEIIYFNETTREGKIESGASIKYFLEGEEYSGPFFTEARKALDWIKNNTEKNSVFLCWVSEAPMIEGYTQRKIIVRYYSLEASSILWPEIVKYNIEYFRERAASNETMRDIVRAFSSTDANETISIMKRHGAQYIFIMKKLKDSNQTRFQYADVFVIAHELWEDPLNGNDDSMIYRLIENRNTGDLVLIYSDEYVNIYKLKPSSS